MRIERKDFLLFRCEGRQTTIVWPFVLLRLSRLTIRFRVASTGLFTLQVRWSLFWITFNLRRSRPTDESISSTPGLISNRA